MLPIHTTYPDSSGSPEDRTQRAPVISRSWATSPRLPISSSSYGNRTHLSALKERNPRPLNERAVLFQSTKKARRLVTPGFFCPAGIFFAWSPAQRMRGAIHRIDHGAAFAISQGAISRIPGGHLKVLVSRLFLSRRRASELVRGKSEKMGPKSGMPQSGELFAHLAKKQPYSGEVLCLKTCSSSQRDGRMRAAPKGRDMTRKRSVASGAAAEAREISG